MTVSAYWGVQSNAPQSVNKSVNMRAPRTQKEGIG
jgi:hypothetical protein